MHLNSLKIQSNLRDYQVYFEENAAFINELASLEPAVFIVDENVWNLYKDNALKTLPKEHVLVFNAKEEDKNLESCCRFYEQIMAFKPRKNLNLVSVGGGIVQDVTGFVASTLYRGIKWTFVPTTLLAQVDSCIGAKTSLNFKHYKNLIGSFYPPQSVYIWPGFVQTLQEVDYYSGIGEMAKLHLMDGEISTYEFLAALADIAERKEKVLLGRICKCLEIKKSYIENDEFDTGRRNMLNYGHCFGHALESATDFAVPHGQAVVLGMLLANCYAAQEGVLDSQTEEFLRRRILLPILKVTADKIHFDVENVISAMGQDKKNIGNGLALVMLENNYHMRKITDLSPARAEELLTRFGDLLQ